MQILYAIIGIYIALCILLYIFQEKLLFFPQPLSLQYNKSKFKKYEIIIKHQGIILHGWLILQPISEEKPLMIYYGGNAQEVSGKLNLLEKINTNSFLLLNYQGYGNSQGKPSQKALFMDALYVIDWLHQEKDIAYEHMVLMGRSLGSGIATYIASQRPVQGIILITPYDSIKHVAQQQYPFFPIGFLLKHPFPSCQFAPKIKAKTLIISAEKDSQIPKKHTLNLIQCFTIPVQHIEIKNAGHNGLTSFLEYFQAINTIFDLKKS